MRIGFPVLVSLCLAGVGAGRARAQAGEFFGARVVAERGRVVLVRGGQPIEIVRPGRSVDVSAAAHLEVGAHAEACVSWPGVASLRLTGPLALEWGTTPGAEAKVGELEPGLELCVLELGRIEIELRAGRARLFLPEGWVSWFGAGAFRVEGRPRGGFEIENRAGAAVKIGRELAEQRVSPALWLEAGSRAPLNAMPDEPHTPDRTAHAQPWPQVDWPWGIRTSEPANPGVLPPDSHDPAAPDATAVAPVLDPSPATPSAAVSTPVLAPPAALDQSAPIAAPVRAPAEFRAEQWHDLARASLAQCGAIVIQVTPALTAKPLPGGRLEVALEREALAPAWTFGPNADVELQPGARVFFDAAGALSAHIGSIKMTQPAPDRPRWSELAPPNG